MFHNKKRLSEDHMHASDSPLLTRTHAGRHAGFFALHVLCVISVHSLTFNTCPREMQMPKEHNGSLPVQEPGCKGR